ncbi:SDR family NAD(P)-dependent oxidoreductase [Lichenihabitans sp. PAMC28606]|uniref:SDR family NAD(P)-dependent oxidoreductase n=1 Tax=Lichenihabitans sp. PAMC28606 TaxID=2880932 RepID=UPI001D0AD3CD|nr:SDR family NAD(P)-dependent oxidoreductase [Lichenihabitans sp. PAMC28606]UDL95689.1 SDR family NAD(P)-dependent oxidoreductase [Lichenihabitans sp. PAMC28606]
MNIDLTGKVALVTGSTEGIGFAIAGGLAASGATVVLNGRTPEKVDAAIEKIKRTLPEANLRGIAADLGTAEGCQATVAALPDVDILINNVGIFEAKDFFATSDDDWLRFYDVNVMSGVRLSRAYLKAMMERDWGRVVFISSESGLNIPPDMLNYGVTKTAMLSVSRGLAKLAKGTGVTVNAVLPGPTLTEGVEAMLEAQALQEGKTVDEVGLNFVKEKRPSSIIQRLATPEEVASLVVYVCSLQASATTGAALRVDGGTVDTIA